MSSIRILITDDYEGWRRQIRRVLEARPEWQVISEASDGLEAVQKAQELKPEIILLDIGLPKLNGIEAARQIRRYSPNSKIVFLSQQNDLDIVRVALSTGALGYVCKTAAHSELLPAMDAALRGQQFISRGLKRDQFTDRSVLKATHRHEVLFYSDDAVLLDRLGRFVATALDTGNAVIVLATKAHRDSLLLKLRAAGIDTDSAVREGTFISLDAAEVLSAVMMNDLPDPDRFFGSVGGWIETAAKAAKSDHPRVVAFGEAVDLLQTQGKPDAAIRLEQLWNGVGKAFGLDILCGYNLTNFHGEKDEHVFQSICAEHSAVYAQ